ncbi:MAG TPA: sigma factor-like helix-turn-helix DNA-binding protein [Actinomycetota bacterium]|nr:sigma factor-like helix-turn-helix DNA-binding protein [Actinomycetota bacterium]
MFQTVGQVVKALKAFRDYYHPKSASVLIASNKTTDVDADPFRRGFLDNMDLRTELLHRLSSLDERERAVLTAWYVLDLPVRAICEQLGLSRSHCYRLRDRALLSMCDVVEERQEVAALA